MNKLLFPDIMFQESNHTYFSKITGELYKSVTTALKTFQKPFPEAIILKKKSEQLGISTWNLKKEWQTKATIGMITGTAIHYYLENLFKNKIVEVPIIAPDDCIDAINEKYAILKAQADNFVNDFPYEVEHLEAILHGGNLCGQCDLICKDENDDLIIVDFKTDTIMRTYSNKLLNELSHLYDHTIVKHGLQVSVYQNMVEALGFKVSKRLIIHFCVNNENYEIIEVPYYEKEAQIIINKIYN
jgi:ATP-dependent exoDNAse (exonuclease V) beta subunit